MSTDTRETIDIIKNGHIYTLVKLKKEELHFRNCRPPKYMGKEGFALQSVIKLKRTR